MKALVTVLLSLGLMATSAVAQTAGGDKKADDKKKTAAAATQRTAAAAAAGGGAVRNWGDIDTNRDNLISPEEMEKYLQAQWAAQKK